jgi:Beta-L-arabinofuranosidase, GH127
MRTVCLFCAPVALFALLVLRAGADAQPPERLRVVPAIHADKPGGLYVGNRAPLVPSPLMKLPIGSITPRGWLRGQLEAEAKGMIGRLEEISKWCKFDGNAWVDRKGQGHSGWEEMPYWLKGYGDLGYVLKDEHIIKEARKWIDAVLAGQDRDGWFGPHELRTALKGKPDVWPNMVMLNVLQSFYEYSGDPRVLPFMTRYFRWQTQVPAGQLLASWAKPRMGDNIESIYWLYNRTGERWLLDLAVRLHREGQRWDEGRLNLHGVNFAQGFREPGVYFVQSRDKKDLDAAERNYQRVMSVYGQFPGGGFAADEICRKGFTDPHQGFETCSIVEFMHSFEMLTRIAGAPVWADRCEELAFNLLPAALTADQKALHYLTGANMVQLDKKNHAPGIMNEDTMLSFSPFEVYRCCQHNVSHGWPYYAEELWLATHDNGLCASLYADSEVTAKVGDGTMVKIVEDTVYPFGNTIHFKLSLPKALHFPLYLRLPGWCDRPSVLVNGNETRITFSDTREQGRVDRGELRLGGAEYIVLEREWHNGDTVELHLPMRPHVHLWGNNQNAISVNYGPLTFSLKIGEEYRRYGGTNEWPEWEVYPTTPWNYGLEIPLNKDPAGSLEVVRRAGNLQQPFTPGNTPILMRARARKIPGWTLDKHGLVAKLQWSPIRSQEPEEWVTLIPMGAARLRITAFPQIGNGPDAHDWRPEDLEKRN